MSQVTSPRLVLVAIMASAVTALTMSLVSRPAHAETPRSAVCTRVREILPEGSPSVTAKNYGLGPEATSAWMTAQLAAGRTSFLVVDSWPFLAGNVNTSICAW